MGNDIVLFGGLLLDRYFHIDRWPTRGQDGFFDREEAFVGGCAINMAVTIHHLGGHAHVVSCVGDDHTAQSIRCYLKEHGLSNQLVLPVSGPTGRCLVFSEPEGERTFLTRKGVETSFPMELASAISSVRPAWAGVTGYYLLGDDAPRILDCLERLHRGGTKILFDPSPLVGDIHPQILEQIVSLSDVLTPNASELMALGGESRLPALAESGKIILFKQGAAGGRVYAPGETFHYASAPCTAVDTTGAGDSFSGAFLYAQTCRYPLRQAVELAAQCAAKTVQFHGPHRFWNLEEFSHA